MLEKISKCDFDEIYKIMKESFPREERRSKKGQAALFNKDFYSVYVLRDKGNKIMAFAAAYEFEAMMFIEHLAVCPEHRNRGLGALLINEIKSLASNPICLEVEEPDSEIAKRRIGFYERLGFILNNYPYVQPSLGKGRAEIPLKIMSYPEPLSNSEFKNIKEALYKTVYNVKSAD